MSEELTESGSSQGINPRLRSTRRVRPVPYECCGGLCSMFNTGCFSMCCGPPKIKKRNSVSKRVKKNKAVPKPLSPEDNDEQTNVQISESPKKLIIPNDDDGLTEEDRKEFNKSIPRQTHDTEENSKTDVFIIENIVELNEIPTRKDVDDERDSAFSMNEDMISNKTDDVSISGSEISTKKKKKSKLIGMLKMGKKKKNQDGISMASSSSSLTSKGNIEPSLSDHHWENLEAAPSIFQKCPVNTKSQENLDTVEEIPLHEKFSHSPNDTSDGLKEENTVINEDVKTVDENEIISVEEDIIVKTEASIPLSTSVSRQVSNENEEVENDDMVQPAENIKKKPFWKSAFKKDRSKSLNRGETELESEKNTTAPLDTEKDKENALKKKSFLGKWGSLKRAPTPSPSHDENQLPESKFIAQEEPEIPSIEVQENELTIPDNETHNIEPKKRTLLRSLGLSKKEKTEKGICEPGCQQKCTETPCLFSVCVNSNVQPQVRKTSGDSLEVKTIDSFGGDTVGKNEAPIRIIRNQFFPAEVRDFSDEPIHTTDGITSGVEETEQLGVNTVMISDSKIEQNNEKDVSSNIQEVYNTEDSGKNSSENAESPVFKKKYGVFDKEDFSESLHTLVDNESAEYIILAPTKAVLQSESSSKTADEKRASSDTSSSEIVFRTSCRLSIDGSTEEFNPDVLPHRNISVDGSSNDEHSLPLEKSEFGINDSTEAIKNDNSEQISAKSESLLEVLTSTETLIEHSEDENILEKSTDTLTNQKESSDWVDVANIEDLSDSKFNYIYKTTVRNINGDKTHHIKYDQNHLSLEGTDDSEQTEMIKIEDEAYSSTHSDSSCEKCGQLLEDRGSNEEIKCVCGTLTRARDSVLQLEEGNVMKKVAAFNESEHPIIVPIISVDHVGATTDKDDVTISEAHSSPSLGSKSGSKSATPSPIAAKSRSGTLSSTNSEWQNAEEDIDRMMVIQGRSSLSSLGLRSDSMASVYSGAGEGRYGTVTVKGQVEFGLQYNYKAGALEIHVKQCKDLASVDTKRNRSDPYVKVYLLPDKSKGGKRKTKVKKHTLNPVFDETLKFHISLNGLETRTLWLTVWHSDMFGRNDFLGEVMMALENKVFDDPTPKLYNLQERTEPFDDTLSFKGDIIVCLKFVPPDMTVQKKGKRSRGTLHVLVKEAKYLTAYKANGTSDPFCKSYLLPDKGRNSKQKTPVIKKTVNPVWNHTFVYDDVTLQELAERCLELTVWDHDRLASNEFLGGVRFSLGTGKHYGKSVEWMDATGKEMSLWKSMLERPNFWVEGCLSLRPTLDARTS